jgi:hypothetical protein
MGLETLRCLIDDGMECARRDDTPADILLQQHVRPVHAEFNEAAQRHEAGLAQLIALLERANEPLQQAIQLGNQAFASEQKAWARICPFVSEYDTRPRSDAGNLFRQYVVAVQQCLETVFGNPSNGFFNSLIDVIQRDAGRQYSSALSAGEDQASRAAIREQMGDIQRRQLLGRAQAEALHARIVENCAPG